MGDRTSPIELLRFHHLKRYSFRLDEDSDQPDLLIRKYDAVSPAAVAELAACDAFLRQPASKV